MRTALRSLLSGVVLATTLVAAPTAAQAACAEAAGPFEEFRTLTEADLPDEGDPNAEDRYLDVVDSARLNPEADDPYALVLNGGGFGHGIGVSQFGMQGAGLSGCSAEQILTTYLPGTELTTVPDESIRVGLFPDTAAESGVEILGFRATGTEAVRWEVDGDLVLEQPPETNGLPNARYACIVDGSFTIHTSGTCADTNLLPEDEGDAGPHGTTGSRLTIDLSPDARVSMTADGREFGRGRLDLLSRGEDMTSVAVLPTLDQYLYGLAEVPSLWSAAALEAQAIAGRSFAVLSQRNRVQCDCDIYRTTFDQFYAGWAKEDAASPATGGQQGVDNWRGAVDRTSGVALGYDRGNGTTPIKVFYSSSHGGSSSSPDQVWGTDLDDFPYLKVVNTSGWEGWDASANRLHRWSKGFTQADLAARFGWDTWTGIEVLGREPGGRPQLDPPGVRATGVLDGVLVEQDFSGEQIRGVLGLRSSRFYLSGDEPAPPSVALQRAAGETRLDTAVLLSQAGWESATDVVIARSDDPADALAGSVLAGQLDAPVLLSPTGALPPVVADELDRLGVTTVWLLGGEVALGQDVAAAAAVNGREVRRLEGENRFATSVAIATQVVDTENAVVESTGGDTPTPDGDRTAYLVRGRDTQNPTRAWADALAVSAVAATRARDGAAWPVLTTDDELPPETLEALEDLGIGEVVPVGGDLVVTPAATTAVEAAGVLVGSRLSGADRWATSRAVLESAPPAEQRLVIATGQAFPDGLAAGPYAAHIGGALLMVPSDLDTTVAPWRSDEHPTLLRDLGWRTSRLVIAGGTGAVSTDVAERVEVGLLSGLS